MYIGHLHRTRTRSGNFILMKKKEKETDASFKQLPKVCRRCFPMAVAVEHNHGNDTRVAGAVKGLGWGVVYHFLA